MAPPPTAKHTTTRSNGHPRSSYHTTTHQVGGNYGPTIGPAAAAQEKGCAQVLLCDHVAHRHVFVRQVSKFCVVTYIPTSRSAFSSGG